MMYQNHYLAVYYDDFVGPWVVADDQGLIDSFTDRQDAIDEALKIGRHNHGYYGWIEVYDKDDDLEDSYNLGGGQQNMNQQTLQATNQIAMTGAGAMIGVGMMGAIGDAFGGME